MAERPQDPEQIAATTPTGASGVRDPTVRGFRVEVVEGPGRGATIEPGAGRCAIGSHASNDLVVDDPTVSRFHCTIDVDDRGARVRDAGSLNGTSVDGVVVADAFVRSGSILRLGTTAVRFDYLDEVCMLPLSSRAQFGALVGGSVAMRATYALLERAASTDATVLLTGETGTGKSAAARALHAASARADRGFAIVDCASISPHLLESELFGHERGAFTGASDRRVGAFEHADGGTVFLDEVGELPAELQPKLLHVLEEREIRRIGDNAWRPVDVRVVAATHRDLRVDVNLDRFRPDLYYRLAVLEVPLPPLRERPEDIEVIAAQVLRDRGIDPAAVLGAELIDRMRRAAWPGNVRELRNYLERCAAFGGPAPLRDLVPAAASTDAPVVDTSVPFADARKRVVARFERAYLTRLMHEHGGVVAAAARAAGIDRVHLYRLLRRHGLRD